MVDQRDSGLWVLAVSFLPLLSEDHTPSYFTAVAENLLAQLAAGCTRANREVVVANLFVLITVSTMYYSSPY
jgi:hypothetical protein